MSVFIVGSGIVGYSCIEICNPETRDRRPAPHYICPLANSYLCGTIPMCQLINCKFDGKTFDPYKFK
jgi:hypothetical protein